jgi:hypothetical protein
VVVAKELEDFDPDRSSERTSTNKFLAQDGKKTSMFDKSGFIQIWEQDQLTQKSKTALVQEITKLIRKDFRNYEPRKLSISTKRKTKGRFS